MTIGCSDDFVSVRLGFPNVSTDPWYITRAIGRPSSGFNDYITPTGDARWTAFTMANGGAESEGIVSDDSAPQDIRVRGLDDSVLTQTARVQWTWTDWASMRSLPADRTTGMRVLMLRALVPSGQTVTFANGQMRTFTGNQEFNRGFDMLIGGVKFNADFVSNPDQAGTISTQGWIDNQLGPGTLFPMVQFLTCKPGISGIVTGDSHAQGTSTAEQFSGFLHSATTAMGTEYLDHIPFSMTNCAVGGLSSKEFFARFQVLIQAIRPSYALLPGWTFNDKTREIHADQTAMDTFLGRLLSISEACDHNGILPIILTPFPRNAEAMTATRLAPWRWLREVLLALPNSAATVIDTTAILGCQENGVFDGTYRSHLSSDQMHPNDTGHTAVGEAIANLVRRLL